MFVARAFIPNSYRFLVCLLSEQGDYPAQGSARQSHDLFSPVSTLGHTSILSISFLLR